MPGADGMNSKFMKNAFVGWTFTAGLYYPPDFDSTKLMPLKHLRPKGQKPAMNIRMMFPFTMICDSCNEYNYTGTKFTAKVEDIKNEIYLGLKVYRFYGRCRHCWAEFTFKTDPKNSDYTMESGGKRTYEAWKDADMMEAQLKAEKERDAAEDQMKALEQKSVDVHAEMQRLEDLDAIRTMNKRLGARDQTIEEALEYLFRRDEREALEQLELPPGDLVELQGFRDQQEEKRRRALDEAVNGDADEDTIAGTSPASSSTATAPGSALGVQSSIQGAAIASAIAERAGKQVAGRAGARLSVKRKAVPVPVIAPAGPDNEESERAAKRPVAAATGDGEVAAGSTLGLGTYESDSS